MNLTVQIKLLPEEPQANLLKITIRKFNAACNSVSKIAWDSKTFNRFKLQKLVYEQIKKKFGLSAQAACLCVAKVVNSYKKDKKIKRTFKPFGSMQYDERILSFKLDAKTVSIWTTIGRITIPFACSKQQLEMISGKRCESKLALVRGSFYLLVCCEVEIAPLIKPNDVLGVDFGIVNIATDSDGQFFSGEKIEDNRQKYSHRRKNLQKKGTKSSKRKLKKMSGKQKRFQKDTNHVISKLLVQKAKDTDRAIALENLKGIRDRVTVRRKQRNKHNNWSFYQLRQFIEYKAELFGVPVIIVDPRNTSRTCPNCGHIDKNNRKTQNEFICTVCRFADRADFIAATNISRQGYCQLANGLSS